MHTNHPFSWQRWNDSFFKNQFKLPLQRWNATSIAHTNELAFEFRYELLRQQMFKIK